MILEDSIKINAPANIVYDCLVKCITDIESYKKWHHEHQDIQWLRGAPTIRGSIMYIEEYLQGYLLKQKYKIINVIPNEIIKFRVLFPLSIFAPENNFFIKAIDDKNCIFIAMGKINMPVWLFYKMHKSHKHKLEASQLHMKEEGENLKKIAEQMYQQKIQ